MLQSLLIETLDAMRTNNCTHNYLASLNESHDDAIVFPTAAETVGEYEIRDCLSEESR